MAGIDPAGSGRRRGGRPDGESEPASPAEARRAIEESRGRITATLDELEWRLQEKKAEVRRRLDVARPVRERVRADPWKAVGVALLAGVAAGFLLGGGKESERRPGRAERRERREWRKERRERLRRRSAPTGGDAATAEPVPPAFDPARMAVLGTVARALFSRIRSPGMRRLPG